MIFSCIVTHFLIKENSFMSLCEADVNLLLRDSRIEGARI